MSTPEHSTQIPAMVLHRDRVRRIVVWFPVEEQNNTGDTGDDEDGQKVGQATTLKTQGQD